MVNAKLVFKDTLFKETIVFQLNKQFNLNHNNHNNLNNNSNSHKPINKHSLNQHLRQIPNQGIQTVRHSTSKEDVHNVSPLSSSTLTLMSVLLKTLNALLMMQGGLA
jgi:hypothetical protein